MLKQTHDNFNSQYMKNAYVLGISKSNCLFFIKFPLISNDLFFISNYCYTEIEKEYNINYTNILLPKVNNGFIIWQNGGNNGGYPITNCDDIIRKKTKLVIEEKPQTDAGYDIFKNYFVYF